MGTQCGYGEGHGDAVISEGIQFGPAKSLSARNPQAVFAFFHLRAHFPQIGDDRCDPIRFLHPQFSGITHFESLLAERSDRGQYRNLIDERSRVRPGDGRVFQFGTPDSQRAHHLPVDLLQLGHRDLQTHLHENIQEAGAGGIHQEIGNGELRTGKQRRRAQKKGRA